MHNGRPLCHRHITFGACKEFLGNTRREPWLVGCCWLVMMVEEESPWYFLWRWFSRRVWDWIFWNFSFWPISYIYCNDIVHSWRISLALRLQSLVQKKISKNLMFARREITCDWQNCWSMRTGAYGSIWLETFQPNKFDIVKPSASYIGRETWKWWIFPLNSVISAVDQELSLVISTNQRQTVSSCREKS